MPRFIFRQFDCRDLHTFLVSGYIRSKNYFPLQACHQTSYGQIVARRGEEDFYIPTGGVVNDYVPFYFSPITSFSYSINKGNVLVIDPAGVPVGQSSWLNRVFVVYRVEDIVESDLTWCYSDFAVNSHAPAPAIVNDISVIENHIDWTLFDEAPIVARIPEIGYEGSCKYFFQQSHPRYALRQRVRMAEFLIRDSVPLGLACAIVCPSAQSGEEAETLLSHFQVDVPVIVRQECFIR